MVVLGKIYPLIIYIHFYVLIGLSTNRIFNFPSFYYLHYYFNIIFNFYLLFVSPISAMR